MISGNTWGRRSWEGGKGPVARALGSSFSVCAEFREQASWAPVSAY